MVAQTIAPFLNRVNAVVINPLIILVFAIAFLVFFWGLFLFIMNDTNSDQKNEGKKKIMWGLIGMFIMFSAYGLIRIVLGTFGIQQPSYLNQGSSLQR